MEAIQVNQANLENPKAEPPKNGSEVKKLENSSGKFFSLIKNLISGLERENYLKEGTKKVKSEAVEADDILVKGIKLKKLNTKKDFDKKDLKLSFDEEVIPSKLIAEDLEKESVVKLPQISLDAVLKDTKNALDSLDTNDNEKPKTLLQTLLSMDNKKVTDKDIESLLEETSKLDKPKLKQNFTLAKFKQQADTSEKNNEGQNSDKNTSQEQKLFKKLLVEDFRSAKKLPQAENLVSDTGTHSTNGERVSTEGESSNQLNLGLSFGEKAGEVSNSLAGEKASGKTGETMSFSQVLAEQLYQANEDLVQAGKIILRNNNEGTIRLNLYPENLGKVKIFLEMHTGKKLSGKITVDTKETLSAFQENLSDLVASFEESGFEMAGFELSWSGAGENGERFMNEQKIFGFSSVYENDLPLMENEDLAEKVLGFGESKAVNVLA
ncbi:MAG: flagellar hook-length control protein FliK [Treponemataceae bacterium]